MQMIYWGGEGLQAILIVEDNELIQREIELSISNIDRGIKIMTAKEGKEALQIVENMAIDVFIIDIGLPDMNGITLAKEIRKKYRYNPIIIESSMGNSVYQNKVHDQIQNIAFLKKPYSSKKMILKISNALDMAESLNVKSLKIKQNSYMRVININEILYIEKVKGTKKIVVTLYSPNKRCLVEESASCSLSSLLANLENKNELIQCHKGYIINPKMIEKLNYVNDTVLLKYTDKEIPIGKTFRSALALLV